MYNKIDRTIVLETLIKHETLTIEDLMKKENSGVMPDQVHLKFLLEELSDSGHIVHLKGVTPLTYSITRKGIEEGVRLGKLNRLPSKIV
jgi:hypothetical protein